MINKNLKALYFLLFIISFHLTRIFAKPSNFERISKSENTYFNCLLLFNSNNITNPDINFSYICNFYGLTIKKIDLSSSPVRDSLLKNKNGDFIKSICIAYCNLSDTTLLDTQELLLIKEAVKNGSNLIITEINDFLPSENIKILTDSQFIGANFVTNENGWFFTNNNESITSTFTNTKINNSFKEAFNIQAINDVSLLNDINNLVTIFSYIEFEKGKIFLDGNIQNKNIEKYRMCELYNPSNLNNILPLMMFVKFSNGNECWHNIHKYANLTIDDPYFIEPFKNLNFHKLLKEMEMHNFHTTIAYIPKYFNYPQDSSVIELFRNHPDRYSIVQHGNNHDGYEFICFTQEELDSLNALYNNKWIDQTPRPYLEQENDIVEGLTRLYELRRKTGIDFGKIMIFPYGISLSPTFEILKMYNFNATVNGQNHPYLLLEGDNLNNYDFNMRPANTNFKNFPVVKRTHPCFSYNPISYEMDFWKFNLFLDKPILLYSHADEIFKEGIDKFNPVADSINFHYPEIEWRSLEYIIKKMYLEKLNYDGSIDVMIHGNNVLISNETKTERVYHIKKSEKISVPVLDVTIDGIPISYCRNDSLLYFDIIISPNTEKEIKINYSSGNKDFTIDKNSINYDLPKNKINIKIKNLGICGGACPIAIYTYNSEFDSTLLFLSVVHINGFDSTFIEFNPKEKRIKNLHIILDPFNIIYETNESNNETYYNHILTHPEFYISKNITTNRAEFSLILPEDSPFNFEIFDIIGRRVYFVNEFMNSGYKKLFWDGSKLPPGIYFARIKVKEYTKTIKFFKIR